jgi:hypothetical protein
VFASGHERVPYDIDYYVHIDNHTFRARTISIRTLIVCRDGQEREDPFNRTGFDHFASPLEFPSLPVRPRRVVYVDTTVNDTITAG